MRLSTSAPCFAYTVEMGLGKHFANEFRCSASIDQVIVNQHRPVPFVRHPFQNLFSIRARRKTRTPHDRRRFTGDDRCRDETALVMAMTDASRFISR